MARAAVQFETGLQHENDPSRTLAVLRRPVALVPGVASAGMDARRIGRWGAARRTRIGRAVAAGRALAVELEQSRFRYRRRSGAGLSG